MKTLIPLIGILILSCAAPSAITREIRKFQEDLNLEYRNPEESPLRGENFADFKEHPFFPIDLKFRVKAKFIRTANAVPFEIPTSSGKTKPYVEFAKATFTLEGKSYVLKIYQNLNLITKDGYEDYLFLPFHDATNGKETYGGGKYLDLRIPKSDEIILDFNRSYQPFCAYNAFDYSCPIVPEENTLPIRIEAGVKYDDVYFH